MYTVLACVINPLRDLFFYCFLLFCGAVNPRRKNLYNTCCSVGIYRINLNRLLCITLDIVSSTIHILKLKCSITILSIKIGLHSRLNDRPCAATTIKNSFITHSLCLTVTNKLSLCGINLTRSLCYCNTCWEILILRSKTSSLGISVIYINIKANLICYIDCVYTIIIIIITLHL